MNVSRRSVLLIAAGVLLLLSCAAHAGLGWPAVRHELVEHGTPEGLVATMAIGWLFGSVAMGAFGAIALVAGLGVPGGGYVSALIVGLVTFGLGLLNVPGIVMTIFTGSLLIVVIALPILWKMWKERRA